MNSTQTPDYIQESYPTPVYIFNYLLLAETNKVTQGGRKRYKLQYATSTHFELWRKKREEKKRKENKIEKLDSMQHPLVK